MECYRHDSVLMHGAIALTDTLQASRRGHFVASAHALARYGAVDPIWSLLREEVPRPIFAYRRKRTIRPGPVFDRPAVAKSGGGLS